MKSKKFAGTQYKALPLRATVLHPELLAKAIDGGIITLEGQFFILIIFVTKLKFFYKTIKVISTSDLILFQKQIKVQY